MRMRHGMFLLVAVLLIALSGPATTLADAPPRVTNVTIPTYPAMAVAKKTGGAVLVDIEVNAAGMVTEASAISGPELLREAAKKAASRWRFERTGGGESTRSVRLTFIFHEPSYIAPKKKPQFTSPYQVEVEWSATADCFGNC